MEPDVDAAALAAVLVTSAAKPLLGPHMQLLVRRSVCSAGEITVQISPADYRHPTPGWTTWHSDTPHLIGAVDERDPPGCHRPARHCRSPSTMPGTASARTR